MMQGKNFLTHLKLIMGDTKFNKDRLKIVDDIGYGDFILELRNTLINPSNPLQYDEWNEYLENNHTWFARVALYNSNPVGYVGIFNNEITIAVIPDFQDRGIGLSLLQDMRKSPAFKKEKTYAKVRPENIKSLKAFKKAGFKTKYLHLY